MAGSQPGSFLVSTSNPFGSRNTCLYGNFLRVSKQSAVERAARAAADFGDAHDAVDQAAAEVLGISRTVLRILGVVHLDGPQSAGRLAVAVGLSPAATTEAVQRLVARGLLGRRIDHVDRRRAVITLTPAAEGLVEWLYGPVRTAGFELLCRYTAEELDVIAEFLERGRQLQLAEADRIRTVQELP